MWTDCPVVNHISVHYRKAQQECGQIVPLLMILVFISIRWNMKYMKVVYEIRSDFISFPMIGGSFRVLRLLLPLKLVAMV